jgi:subtilisin family serine protease
MEQFPHLNFVQKVTGTPRLFGGGSVNPQSKKNSENRQGHSGFLTSKTSKLKDDWSHVFEERRNLNLAPLDENIIPIFLKINPDLLSNVEFDLQSLGIEIISEEDNGFIMGASSDGLHALEEKINGFIVEARGTGIIADLWEIIAGHREEWKPIHILSEGLYASWDKIKDDELYKLEVSIAFDKPLGKEPDPSKHGGETRLQKFKEQQIKRDELLMERETHFEEFINHYGKINSSLVDLEDSFACEVEINGKGLKDLVFNYPFVFEVKEIEDVSGLIENYFDEQDIELEILPPEHNVPVVGLIDSGIMENHKYLAPAIIGKDSRSYIHGDTSTADVIKGGGHGTAVAGAILFPNGVSILSSPYQLPCFIRNLRVLNSEGMIRDMFPAELMQKIIKGNDDCTIYNLSINARVPYTRKHMSTWAASIDSLTHEKNVLFIISSGNIPKGEIRSYLNNKLTYPNYLQNPNCRIANPGQSSFGLVVGSINHAQFEDEDWKSLGVEREISAFSRIGNGIWGEIKPDVVEFGGGLLVSKNGHNLIKESKDTSPELLRSTLHGGNAFSKDRTGTSFAAPKVSYIASQLQKLYPNENVNLLRALIVQGARLPNEHFLHPTKESIQCFGYGLPAIDRVTRNTNHRITFYNTGKISFDDGHLYSLLIPSELRNPADEYDILIEVTLAYTAKVRRTRQRTKSYLSTWLDWISSKIDESFDDFKDFALKEIEKDETDYDTDSRNSLNNYSWKIKNRSDFGVEDLNRNNSTVQKDWAIIKSYQLPTEISFAVRSHKGWDKNNEEIPYAITVTLEALNDSIAIYESIRIENEIEIPIRV